MGIENPRKWLSHAANEGNNVWHVRILMFWGQLGHANHAVRSKDTLLGYFWITINLQTSHAGSQPWSPGVMQWNLQRCTESNQPILPGSPMLWCLQLPSNRIRQTLTHQVQVQQKISKFGWFHFGSISLSLECYLRISHFFLDGNPLSFLLQFPRKLIFTGEPPKRKLHFPVQIAIFVAELPNERNRWSGAQGNPARSR